MILKLLPITLLAAFLAGCATTNTVADKTTAYSTTAKDTATSQSSYDLALLHIKALREGKFNLDQPAYERGLRDALNGKANDNSANTPSTWQSLATVSYEELKTANLAAGKAFLEQNKTRKGIITLPSGVQYEVLQQGKDAHKPTLNDSIGIMYSVKSIDGKIKINTMNKGKNQMYEIPLKKIISKGWREALQLMSQESKWRLYIPGELAFGEKGLSEKGILPNETLVIDTFLLEIKPST
ncbi:MAG: FKBP-type peptidyl-prolyl cis-trans isomerase N-terminal domain-containing protein [Methylococcales bacterium]